MRVTLLAVCVAALAACEGGNEDSAAAVAQAPVQFPADTAAAARKFPIPFPENGTIMTDARAGGSGHVTIRYPAERYGAIVTFYDSYTGESGGWNRSEAGQGDVPSINYMNLGQGWNITVDPPTREWILITLTAS